MILFVEQLQKASDLYPDVPDGNHVHLKELGRVAETRPVRLVRICAVSVAKAVCRVPSPRGVWWVTISLNSWWKDKKDDFPETNVCYYARIYRKKYYLCTIESEKNGRRKSSHFWKEKNE